MELYSLSLEDLTKTANTIKECLLGALEREGLLIKTVEEIASNYVIVLHKQGWLGRFFRRVTGKPHSGPNSLAIDVMKVV